MAAGEDGDIDAVRFVELSGKSWLETLLAKLTLQAGSQIASEDRIIVPWGMLRWPKALNPADK
jgi:hypothetical protein